MTYVMNFVSYNWQISCMQLNFITAYSVLLRLPQHACCTLIDKDGDGTSTSELTDLPLFNVDDS